MRGGGFFICPEAVFSFWKYMFCAYRERRRLFLRLFCI